MPDLSLLQPSPWELCGYAVALILALAGVWLIVREARARRRKPKDRSHIQASKAAQQKLHENDHRRY